MCSALQDFLFFEYGTVNETWDFSPLVELFSMGKKYPMKLMTLQTTLCNFVLRDTRDSGDIFVRKFRIGEHGIDHLTPTASAAALGPIYDYHLYNFMDPLRRSKTKNNGWS